jgi:cytochrome c oxidase cbb3-type subunit 3
MSEYRPDQIRDHTYDGIQEFDNRLPNWWLWTLYGTIIFAVLYWLVFQTLGIVPLPRERYEMKVIEAKEAELARMEEQGVSNESLQLQATLPARVNEGRALFEKYCVVCHNDQGQGKVGPNLTDAYWLHGGAPMDILNTITNGVTDKGMAAWGRQLGPNRVQALVSYVLTIVDTNVPGKEPQGEPYERE